MVAYATGDHCRMQYLRDALDDAASAPCGRCDHCTGVTVVAPAPEVTGRALTHLRSGETVLEARKLWPGGLGIRKGRISGQAEAGRALAFGNDPGWFALGVGRARAEADCARGRRRSATTLCPLWIQSSWPAAPPP